MLADRKNKLHDDELLSQLKSVFDIVHCRRELTFWLSAPLYSLESRLRPTPYAALSTCCPSIPVYRNACAMRSYKRVVTSTTMR